MTPENKRRLLRYGIAADLVIVITGVGLLLPDISSGVVALLYGIAVALCAVKGGARSALAATALGLVAILAAFHATMPALYTAGLVVFGLATSVASAAFTAAPADARPPMIMPPLAPVATFDEEPEEDEAREAERLAAEEAERAAR